MASPFEVDDELANEDPMPRFVAPYPDAAGPKHERPIVMLVKRGMPDWLNFQGRLGVAAMKAGAINSMPDYPTHLTSACRAQAAERSEFEPIRWTAREFTLTRSHPEKGLHDKLATWPLYAAESEA